MAARRMERRIHAKLTITLNSENSGGSKKQPIYQLAWDDGTNGAGILIKDARATNFLAASFGGSSCGAVFYSIDPATITLTGTRLKLNKPEIGFRNRITHINALHAGGGL